ncbi:methyltransferase [Brachybacterium sp. MASK1Z-5]|uniref:Methyltransferase n=1 Tax=Brachybacterium halotolerans TaxID=2795215 RepID=A0ABS1B5S7_9MICO|nr:methyltransferase [Brachybacterium halotolerans]MBK0329990.1 methyltransferase [Brachybacterium halotolerans]
MTADRQDPAGELVLEVLEGCGPFARREAEQLGTVVSEGPTELRLTVPDLPAAIPFARSWRRVVSASAVLALPARRPRELLETSAQQRIGELIEQVRRAKPRRRFDALRLRAAGADTPDMRRLSAEIAERAGLPVADDGDLVIRVRRAPTAGEWELLVRLTPRPLSTRSWRTGDYPGAVNATIAASCLDLLGVGVQDSLLDMTCGSGTFLIEQLHEVAPRRAVGVDLSEQALELARGHQRAARRRGRIDWVHGDVLGTPLEGGFTRLVSNPPWGTLHGEHESNEQLLGDLMSRAAELAAPRARLAILTHEIRRMHAALEGRTDWRLADEHRFFQKGHHPRLFLLDRG